jgi:hypothetical protein
MVDEGLFDFLRRKKKATEPSALERYKQLRAGTGLDELQPQDEPQPEKRSFQASHRGGAQMFGDKPGSSR